MTETEPGTLLHCCRNCVAVLKPEYIKELCRYVRREGYDRCETCPRVTKELSECERVQSQLVIEMVMATADEQPHGLATA